MLGLLAYLGAELKYLHTMLRVRDLDKALDFFCNKLGLSETRRKDSERGRFTLVFLGAEKGGNELELTYNWDQNEEYPAGRFFGHLAYQVDNIYDFCQSLMDNGVEINRPPRDGYMAFIKSPDGHSIELLQKGEPLEAKEPWASMGNKGSW
jgi:lactoylglutathione lyase